MVAIHLKAASITSSLLGNHGAAVCEGFWGVSFLTRTHVMSFLHKVDQKIIFSTYIAVSVVNSSVTRCCVCNNPRLHQPSHFFPPNHPHSSHTHDPSLSPHPFTCPICATDHRSPFYYSKYGISLRAAAAAPWPGLEHSTCFEAYLEAYSPSELTSLSATSYSSITWFDICKTFFIHFNDAINPDIQSCCKHVGEVTTLYLT